MFLASAAQTFAVVGVVIQVQGTNLVLSWPSHGYETYLIQHRPTLDQSTPWTDLANNYPANSTNRTTYIIPCCILAALGGGENSFSGGGESSTSSGVLTASESGKSDDSSDTDWWAMPKDGSGDAVPLVLYPPGFDTSNLVLVEPPKPDAEAETISELVAALDGPEGNGPLNLTSGGCECPNMGFFRVFDVSPVAVPAFFGVGQDSFENQLNIFRDNYDPNDEFFFLSNVVAPQHGTNVYSLDASTFQYTPTAGFYGTDSFNYSITNLHGGTAFATVTVFVNQSGNALPAAGQTIITLATNNYTAALNVLTNASDPDNDTLTLFSLGTVRLGTLSSNGSGNVTYQRNPDLFGRDEFTYVVTDGRGGYDIGSIVILQVDTDEDGMPDEYENRSGLDATSDDSSTDPDNDGLPNLAEFKLQKNPHASDNPLNLSMTNGTKVSGFVQLPLVGLTPFIEKQPIALYLNGDFAANSFLTQGPDGQWLLNWDTTFLTNGNYSIKAGFQYKSYSPLSETNTVFGTGKTVQVTNLISFDSFTSKFADFLLIDAKLAVQSATYRVDLYDEAGTPLVYGIFTTTNGIIQIYWDLTDGNGNQLAFGSVNSEFRIGPPGTTNFASLDPVLHWFVKDTPNPGDGFVVAWGWDVYNTTFNNRREQLMLDGVINLLGNPADPTAYNLSPSANVAYANTFRYDSAADKKTLLMALEDPGNGNFFWFGHGSSTGFAGNENTSLTVAADVELELKNFAYKSNPKRPQTNAHPYRLVILNGCESYSPEWANAFGIGFDPQGGQLDIYYDAAGRPKRAFVGWTEQIDVPGWRFGGGGNTHPEYAYALGQLFFNWMQGYFLNYSVNQFANTATAYGFSNATSNRISGCINMTR